jgi:pentose-5-phosphate-3-epimerase
MLTFMALRIQTTSVSVLCFISSCSAGSKYLLYPMISTRAYLDCHLMVTSPSDYVEALGKAGASGFTFHIEVARGKRVSVGK